MTSLLLVKIFVATGALGGGAYLLKKLSDKESKKDLMLERITETLDERVEEDFTELKRDHLVNEVLHHEIVYSKHDEFKKRLIQVHKLLKEKDFKHPRAHTLYSTLLPRLLKIKETKAELSGYTGEGVDTEEMYQSLNIWLDEIIDNKIDALENEAEINAKVITLLTK